MEYETTAEWVHIQYPETAQFREVYGFAGSQGMVNLEGIRFLPRKPSKTLDVFMHPATTLQLLPVPRALAEAGVHVLCAGSRFAKNDTPLIMEKVVLDLGAYIRHAKERWGYEKIVLQKGGFWVDATRLNKKLNSGVPTLDRARCSFTFKGSGPTKLFKGSGAYAGISGNVNVTVTFVGVLPKLKRGKCNLNRNAQPLAQFGVVTGSGTASY